MKDPAIVIAERNELARRAAASVIQDAHHGRAVDPVRLEWALQMCAKYRPLGRPLGTGEPDLLPF